MVFAAANGLEIATRRGRLRSRWRRRSLTDAAYPLRVRALRSVERTVAVGRDHWARRVQELPFRLRAKGEGLLCSLRERIYNGASGMPRATGVLRTDLEL